MILGCIADDFTGAGDAASFLVKGGMKTLMLLDSEDVWSRTDPSAFDAVVIALKTRTAPVQEAVGKSLAAVSWLKQCGARQFYFKYCSTFDSKKNGNIGPVADAVMDYLNADHAVLCPALPVNGRTVKNGSLYVNGVPLDESPMKDHPLTPMWDHRIRILMQDQSKYPVYNWPVEKPDTTDSFYIVPDYVSDRDGEKIAEVFGDDLFLTGGSGLLEHLAEHWNPDHSEEVQTVEAPGKTLLLAGSCSVATRAQIEKYENNGFASYKINPVHLLDPDQAAAMRRKVQELMINTDSVLIYSSDTPENVKKVQAHDTDDRKTAEVVETFLAQCGEKAFSQGYRKVIVAGGETSGAITKALSYERFVIGPSIAPGVPVLIPLDDTSVRLVLKSGNFGSATFFLETMKKLG